MCNSIACSHDHLDDDLSDLTGGVSAAADFARAALSNATSTRTFEEKCEDCRGTGSFYSYSGRYVGPCFKCKGAGVRRYKQSAEQRAKARDAADARKAKQAAEATERAKAWLEANPVEADWLRDSFNTFEFARSMVEALYKYGHFTEKQEAAVRNAAAKSAARKAQWAAERAEREANKAEVQIGRIAEAFAAAKASRLKWPKLRLDTFVFSLASESGRNAGAIYVKEDETYLGKIADGRFTRSRDCDAATEARIVAACADPAAAAEAYGKATGQCACCGRELTNEESIARSIGPICAEKWGW